jgi:hypothetical protein
LLFAIRQGLCKGQGFCFEHVLGLLANANSVIWFGISVADAFEEESG